MEVLAPLAYVRLVRGGKVALEQGANVPAEADPDHVTLLRKRGVLGDKPAEQGLSAEPNQVVPPKPVEPPKGTGKPGGAG